QGPFYFKKSDSLSGKSLLFIPDQMVLRIKTSF
ncbi:MAG: hypothetical protein ACI9V9_000350, partial [Oleispira sp.]